MSPARQRPTRITPMWLAHHFPEDYDRCVVVGRSHLCRRCLVLYPLAALVMVLSSGWHPATSVDVVLLVLLPLPALVELVLEQFGALGHRALRQVLVTIPLAIGLGRGFALYLDDHASVLFWSVVIGYSAIGAGAVYLRSRRDAGRP